MLFALSYLLAWLGTTSLFVSQSVCVIPGSSLLMPSFCVPAMVVHQAADFTGVDIYAKAFEKMLEKMLQDSVSASILSLDLKKSEITTKDLITLVKVSELKTRDVVVEALADFAFNVKVTSEGLQKLSSHIRHMVDRIVLVSLHALASIDVACNDPNAKSVPWYAPWQPPPADAIVLRKFTECMEYLSDGVERLILEDSVQMFNMADLEGRLDLISELVSGGDLPISFGRDEVLPSLWMLLGRNKATPRRFDSGLSVMQAVTGYRNAATNTIVSVMHTSQEMKAGIQVIRERVAAPGITMTWRSFDFYKQSIEAGLLRLKDLSLQAKEKEREKTALRGFVHVVM